jgi:Cof subfamily protein (haloacid dehalogenase superfamily)
MKKAVFFDIDGTIWDQKMEIPPSTIEGIRALRAKGNYAFICSGRSRCAIQPQKLLDIGFDGIVAGCGTYIEYHDEIILEETLTMEQLEDIQNKLKKLGMPVLLEGSEYLYADEPSFNGDQYLVYLKKMLGDQLQPVEVIDETSKINKMSALYDTSRKAEIAALIGEEWTVVYHESKAVEIMPKGYSKATGIQFVCDRLGIAHEDTYAFGDSANDVEMLRYVKHGIAMGNGTESAKAAADYVTADLHDGGIYKGLEHFGLL